MHFNDTSSHNIFISWSPVIFLTVIDHYLAHEVHSAEDPMDQLHIGPLGGEEEAAVGVGLGDDLLVLQQGLGVS